MPSSSNFDVRTRLRAMSIHLGLSCLVAAMLAAMVFLVWYPSPFSDMSGGRELFFLVVSVDVVLGPLITFAIFNLRKPRRELRRDLAIVALLQLAGLAYGMHTVWAVRPGYIVFEVDRFVVIRPVDLDDGALESAPDGLRSLPRFGPEFIAAELPSDPMQAAKSMDLAFQGRDISTQPSTWRPYTTAVPAVLKRAKPLANLRRDQPRHAAQIDAAAAAAGLPPDRLAYLPIVSRRTEWVALIDNQSAKVVGYLPFGGF